MKDSTVNQNSIAEVLQFKSGAYQKCSQDALAESIVHYENELNRRQHSDELRAEVAKRLKTILTKPEAQSFLAASSEETQMAYAMAAIETFIRNTEPTS